MMRRDGENDSWLAPLQTVVILRDLLVKRIQVLCKERCKIPLCIGWVGVQSKDVILEMLNLRKSPLLKTLQEVLYLRVYFRPTYITIESVHLMISG